MDNKDILTSMGIGDKRADEIDKNEKYEQYKKNGVNTWNRRLNKGQRIMIPHYSKEPGRYQEAFINGFWKNDKLQDDDTYEEGKDNLWHDFRGINLVDRNGKELGNINANQIYRLLDPEKEHHPVSREDLDEQIKQLAEDTYEKGNPARTLVQMPDEIIPGRSTAAMASFVEAKQNEINRRYRNAGNSGTGSWKYEDEEN